MKKLILVILATFCVVLQAEEKKEEKKEYKTMDLKQFQGVENPRDKSKVQFEISCKTESGQQLKATDVGYEECLAQAKKNKVNTNNTEKK